MVNFEEDIYQLLTRLYTLIEKLKDYQRYRQCSEDGIEGSINSILHKYGIKREFYYGGQFNGVCVRHFMADSKYIIRDFLKVSVEAMSKTS